MSVRLSARGENVRPFASSFARTKLSTGVWTSFAFLTPGSGGRWTGLKAQCLVISDFGFSVAWIGRAHLHPGFQVMDLLVRKLSAGLGGRHLEVGVGVADRFDEKTLVRVAGEDGGAGVAPFEIGRASCRE